MWTSPLHLMRGMHITRALAHPDTHTHRQTHTHTHCTCQITLNLRSAHGWSADFFGVNRGNDPSRISATQRFVDHVRCTLPAIHTIGRQAKRVAYETLLTRDMWQVLAAVFLELDLVINHQHLSCRHALWAQSSLQITKLQMILQHSYTNRNKVGSKLFTKAPIITEMPAF